MNFDYDLFIIGAGPGGLAAAKRAAAYGSRVAIAEQATVGGACINYGCIPEKLMAYAASFSSLFPIAVSYGWSQCNSSFDWSKFRLAKDKKVYQLNNLHTESLKKVGVEFFWGHTTFVDAHTLAVDKCQITADKILIAVGAKPVKPDIPGIEYAIFSHELFHLQQQPKHIAIIGSSYIAVKSAGSFNGIGSQVTQVFLEDCILPGFDEDIRQAVQVDMSKRGIQFLENTKVEKIADTGYGLSLTLSGNCNHKLTVDAVLSMAGRIPNLNGLNLEKAGVEVTYGGGIVVDEYSRTTQENIFAIGDCINHFHFTPIATAQSHAFADTEFGNKPQTVNYEWVPISVSSQPEAATVGLTEAQAREKFGKSVQVFREECKPLFYSLTEEEEKTLVKLVVDGNSKRVVGAHVVGEYANEIVQSIALALKRGATKEDFNTMIGIHPSIAEELFTL